MKIDNQNARSLINLMAEAQNEINQLRRRNEILSAKVEVMDAFMCVLHTSPAQRGVMGQSVDVAWQLGEAQSELKSAVVESELPRPAQPND